MPAIRRRETTKPGETWLPLKRILCPIDQAPVGTPAPSGAKPDCAPGPTDAACRAISVAEELAGTFGGELLLLHVVPPTPVAMPMPDGPVIPFFDVAAYEAKLREHYQRTLERLRKERVGPKTRARVQVVTGNAATEIVRLAREEKCDLIVLPTHGRGGFSHLFFGSVAEKVVRHAECPVLTLH